MRRRVGRRARRPRRGRRAPSRRAARARSRPAPRPAARPAAPSPVHALRSRIGQRRPSRARSESPLRDPDVRAGTCRLARTRACSGTDRRGSGDGDGSVSGWDSSRVCQAASRRSSAGSTRSGAGCTGIAQVALERAGQPEPRARGQQDVVPAGRADQPARHRRAQVDPQAQAAGRARRAPAREGVAEPAEQVVAGRGQLGAAGRARSGPGRRPAAWRAAAPAPVRRGRSPRAARPSRRTIGAAVRIQPMRSPPHSTFAADPTVITRAESGAPCAATGASPGPVERQLGEGLVDQQRCPGAPGQRDEPLAPRGVEQRSGRVLVVGDQVGQPRGGVAHRRGHQLQVPRVRAGGVGSSGTGTHRAPRACTASSAFG